MAALVAWLHVSRQKNTTTSTSQDTMALERRLKIYSELKYLIKKFKMALTEINFYFENPTPMQVHHS